MDVRGLCLSFPGAEETFPFGPATPVMKVDGKIFAILGNGSISVKCEPSLAVELRARYPAVAPGYHLNKQHWNTITLDGSIPAHHIADMVEDSYDLIVSRLPRARQVALGWSASPSDSLARTRASAEQASDREDADRDDDRP